MNTEKCQPAAAVVAAAPAAPAGEPEQWHGHQFKEVERGKWKCSCGREILEAAAPAAPDQRQVREDTQGLADAGRLSPSPAAPAGEPLKKLAEMDQEMFGFGKASPAPVGENALREARCPKCGCKPPLHHVSCLNDPRREVADAEVAEGFQSRRDVILATSEPPSGFRDDATNQTLAAWKSLCDDMLAVLLKRRAQPQGESNYMDGYNKALEDAARRMDQIGDHAHAAALRLLRESNR